MVLASVPSSSQALGHEPRPILAVAVTLHCPYTTGAHHQLHPGLAGCPLSLHGHGGMDVPAHPDAKPFPRPLPGLGKCHQPLF